MLNTHAEYDQVVHKKKTLTKWLLLALFFNIILQFDSVEKFFNSQYEVTKVTLTSSEICGSNYNIELPGASKGTIELASLSGTLNQNSSHSQVVFFNKKKTPEFHVKSSKLVILDYPLVLRFIADTYSGLSPPKA